MIVLKLEGTELPTMSSHDVWVDCVSQNKWKNKTETIKFMGEPGANYLIIAITP